jgi:hypothetical protein
LGIAHIHKHVGILYLLGALGEGAIIKMNGACDRGQRARFVECGEISADSAQRLREC